MPVLEAEKFILCQYTEEDRPLLQIPGVCYMEYVQRAKVSYQPTGSISAHYLCSREVNRKNSKC